MSAPAASRRRNGVVLASLLLLVAGMVGLSFAAVPLYTLFCRVTGLGGTTQVADAPSGEVLDRTVRIRFTADTDRALPWDFAPEQQDVEVRLGEPTLAFYRARNRSAAPTAGTAVYNVNPPQAGLYFVKTECFCFTEQVLAGGAGADMPVYFFVDPALADDPGLADLTTITLSYAFFPASSAALDEAKTAYYDSASRANGAAPGRP